jgi:hypothetical protein
MRSLLVVPIAIFALIPQSGFAIASDSDAMAAMYICVDHGGTGRPVYENGRLVSRHYECKGPYARATS